MLVTYGTVKCNVKVRVSPCHYSITLYNPINHDCLSLDTDSWALAASASRWRGGRAAVIYRATTHTPTDLEIELIDVFEWIILYILSIGIKLAILFDD